MIFVFSTETHTLDKYKKYIAKFFDKLFQFLAKKFIESMENHVLYFKDNDVFCDMTLYFVENQD